MKSILLAHAKNYPRMEPTDAVKLIYQNEFGGGHLIRDEEACLQYLRKEYGITAQDPNLPLLEEIGNGLVRVQLAALDARGYTVQALGQAFLRSAARLRGNLDSFRNKLSILQELTLNGDMPFSLDSLTRYLAEYEQAGFPPVSHSETYRNAYHPAYRIVCKDFLPETLLQQIP